MHVRVTVRLIHTVDNKKKKGRGEREREFAFSFKNPIPDDPFSLSVFSLLSSFFLLSLSLFPPVLVAFKSYSIKRVIQRWHDVMSAGWETRLSLNAILRNTLVSSVPSNLASRCLLTCLAGDPDPDRPTKRPITSCRSSCYALTHTRNRFLSASSVMCISFSVPHCAADLSKRHVNVKPIIIHPDWGYALWDLLSFLNPVIKMISVARARFSFSTRIHTYIAFAKRGSSRLPSSVLPQPIAPLCNLFFDRWHHRAKIYT